MVLPSPMVMIPQLAALFQHFDHEIALEIGPYGMTDGRQAGLRLRVLGQTEPQHPQVGVGGGSLREDLTVRGCVRLIDMDKERAF